MEENKSDHFSWYVGLAKANHDHRSAIERKLTLECDQERRMELYMLLGIENVRLDDIPGNIEVFRRAVQEFPSDPLLRTSLSDAYSFLGFDMGRALEEMNAAVEVARSTKQFRRQVLHSKARLLRNMKDYGGLELCLLEIISEPKSETADIAKEDDFLLNLPAGVISDEVMRAYAEFMAL